MKQISTLGLVLLVISCLGVTPAMAANLVGCEPTTEKPCCCPDEPATYNCPGCPPGWYKASVVGVGKVCVPDSGTVDNIPSDTKGYFYAEVCTGQQCFTATSSEDAAARADKGMACFCPADLGGKK